MRRGAAGIAPTPTSSRTRSRTSSPVRPCWSSSAGGRRSGSSSPRRASCPRAGPSRSSTGSAPTGRCCRGLTLALAAAIAEALPGAAGPRPAGDAAAGPARTARVGRRADAGRGGRWAPRRRRRGMDAAVARATADLLAQLARGPRPVRDLAGPDGRAGLLRRLRAPRGGGTGQPRLDAAGCRRRAALRTLDPAAGCGPDGDRGRWPPGSRSRAGRSGRARWSCSRSSRRHRPGNCRRRSWPPVTGRRAAAGLVRRGLAEAEVRERPRRPLAGATRRQAWWPSRRRATSCPPRPRRSTGSWPRSPPETRARSCSMA